MVIYAEYLFAENFIIGLIILILTGKICGIKSSKLLLTLGGILCALYSFTIFFESMPDLLAILSKLFFSAVLVGLVFWPKSIKLFGKIVTIFYIVSFAMGGITIGSMYFFGATGVTNNSSAYIAEPTYLKIAFGCFLSYLALNSLASFLKGRMLEEKTMKQVEILIGERKISVNGLVDTGNFLKDPISGKPVFIISERMAMKFLPKEIIELMTKKDTKWESIYEEMMNTEFADRVRLIPFHSIGKSNGMLLGIRSDRATIKDKQGEQKMDGAVLAISQERFALESKGTNYDLLLHRDVLEGGIACNV